ncbi:MAG: threonine synthase [Ignavibacteriales bacterium]
MSKATGLKCVSCGAEYPVSRMFEGCPRCRDGEFAANLTVQYDYTDLNGLTRQEFGSWKGEGLWRFAPLLPIEAEECRISLLEGDTPLVLCRGVSEKTGVQVFAKDESRGPTWSYKDRLACVATAKALEFGAKVTTVASTGNHGAATAAYAARAGLDCVVFTLPTASEAMLSLMQAYGAKLVATTFYGRWDLMSHCVKNFGWYPLGNYVHALPTGNPFGVEGYKTIAYEICLQRDWEVPDIIVSPVAYGEGFYGIWKGFRELKQLGLIDRTPTMIAVEPSGGPLSNAVRNNLPAPVRVPSKKSVAFSINGDMIGMQALVAIRESGGTTVEVPDAEIMAAQAMFGREGLYVEPSSAASLAAVWKMARAGGLSGAKSIVCIITSSGLKDPGATAAVNPKPPVVEPQVDEMFRALKDVYGFEVASRITY